MLNILLSLRLHRSMDRREAEREVLPLMTITGWLRISGIMWVRFCGTHTHECRAYHQWKTGFKHVRRCQRNRRDFFSSPMIFVNSKRRKWPCVQKGQREGNYDSDRFRSRTLRYSLRRVSPLDSVNCGTHNPTMSSQPPLPRILGQIRVTK